ncbi:MAG: Asp-tRNA(Asn)/Glu-tRNA(Gln) amidotransferase subunit GatB [bacterium]
MEYIPTIGLEIHSELKTKSKMFCRSLNNSDESKPNTNVCPVCMGHPGTLPVANKRAINLVIKTGLALNCKINKLSKFDRKNYFYPDLPKGYQISQYDKPLCFEGYLNIISPVLRDSSVAPLPQNDKLRKIRITRIHLEEDTGKLTHPKGADYSLVDYNRAGVPLMELVTEPDITSGKEARVFCEELQLILRYLNVSDANMEKGQMRCEVNISMAPEGMRGTKVEIKNLNSFRVVEKSIDYEIKRQIEILNDSKKIIQETRGWDDNKQITFSQRIKEGAKDYRYFPDPDLPTLSISQDEIDNLKRDITELPQSRRERFLQEYKIPEQDIKVLVSNKYLANFFEQAVSELKTWLKIKKVDILPTDGQSLIKLTANYILTELQKLLLVSKKGMDDCRVSPENFAEFITLIKQGEISSSAAQAVLKEMFETGADPSHIIEEKGLKQVSDQGALETIVDQVIKDNPDSVKDFKSGKENALQFLIGRTMAVSKGQANPQVVGEILRKKLTD